MTKTSGECELRSTIPFQEHFALLPGIRLIHTGRMARKQTCGDKCSGGFPPSMEAFDDLLGILRGGIASGILFETVRSIYLADTRGPLFPRVWPGRAKRGASRLPILKDLIVTGPLRSLGLRLS